MNNDNDNIDYDLASELNGSSKKSKLEKFAESTNICNDLDDLELQNAANKVLAGFSEDKTSQAKWLQDTEDALKLSRLTKEPKNTPLPQSANIKYPLITTAAYQFAARTYPEIIQDGKIVKTEVAGNSNPVIDAVSWGISTHMSHQLLGASSDWEAGVDKLLVVLPNIGFVCKKTYYDTSKKQNCSEVCFYKDVVLRNDSTIHSINDLRRITHVLHVHPNEIIEKCRAGEYFEKSVDEIVNFYSKTELNPTCTLLEQHRFLDLDKDGYEEPYIVTIHQETNKILRIVARYTKSDIEYNDKNQVQRIAAIQYFTDYHFLPAPDGSFMSLGFGSLMLHMNETVNTILNQLIDAGTLANLQTGFIDSRIKLMGGQQMVDPGSWTRAKAVLGQQLRDGIVPINYKEPSTVLYQLLGTLLEASKQLTSSTDAMQGMQNATNVPATSMLAMIEQGMKMFSAIQRRLYRALKEEFQKIYRLNSIYLNEEDYIEILGPIYQYLPNIYKTKAVKVIPIADPNLSSDAQRLTQAQILMSMAGRPGINNLEVYRRFLEAAKVQNVNAILMSQNPQDYQQQDPKAQEKQSIVQIKDKEVGIKAAAQQLKEKEFVASLSKKDAEITKLHADSVKSVSEAQSLQHGTRMNEHNAQVDAVKMRINAVEKANAQMSKNDAQAKQLQQRQRQMDIQETQKRMELEQRARELENAKQQSVNRSSGQNNQANDNGLASSPNNPGDAPSDNQPQGSE